MATSFPTITNLTGASVTEAQAKTEFTTLYASLREMGDPLGTFGAIQNLGMSFAVATNALTATVTQRDGSTAPTATNVVAVPMRSATATNGAFNVRNITSTLSLTISSGSTLGHTSAVAANIYWYLIDNSGTLELAASTKYFGDSGIVSTTAEGGAGAADSATVMYSTTARSNVPFVCIARTIDTQTTAGTWTAVPSEAFLAPFTQNAVRLSAATTSPAGLLPVTFEGDENTGIYRAAADTIALAANGCDSLRATNSSGSAVNYIQTDGAATGSIPTVAAKGSDTNVGLRLSSQGTGAIRAETGGGLQLNVSNSASAVNYIEATGAATGAAVSMTAQGSDTNVGFNLFGKGTGRARLGNNGSQTGLTVATASSAVNYIEITGTATGTAANISSQGSDTNIGITLQTKGTGVLACAAVYNNTSASAANVFVDSSGVLYRSTSSLRYKSNVEDYGKGISDLLKLRPVSYQSKQASDGSKHFAGFIAEEVHEAGLTEYVVYNEAGEPDALHYGQMIALAVKAIQELKAEVDQLKAGV